MAELPLPPEVMTSSVDADGHSYSAAGASPRPRHRRSEIGFLAPLRPLLRAQDGTLVTGAVSAFGLSAMGMLLGFLSQVLIARRFGASDYGLYVYVLGWSNVATMLCTLEFSNAAVRFVSAYAATRDWPHLTGFLRRSHQIIAVTALVIVALGGIAALILPVLNPARRVCFVIALALFPLTSMLELKGACLQGLHRVVHAQLPNQLLRPGLFVFGLFLLGSTLDRSVGISGAVGLQLLATAAAVVVARHFLRRDLPKEIWTAEPAFKTREWLLTSAHFIGISISQFILSAQADLLIVGTLLGSAEAGLYGAASQATSLIGFGATAVMYAAQPMIAEMYARKQQHELQKLVRHVTTLALLGSVPVFLGLVLVGRPLLSIYGAGFVHAYPVLLVLGLSQLVAASIGMLVGYLMTMTGHQKDAAWIIGASAVLNLALTAALTPLFGIIGTASATAISTVVRGIWLVFAARRRLHVSILPLAGQA